MQNGSSVKWTVAWTVAWQGDLFKCNMRVVEWTVVGHLTGTAPQVQVSAPRLHGRRLKTPLPSTGSRCRARGRPGCETSKVLGMPPSSCVFITAFHPSPNTCRFLGQGRISHSSGLGHTFNLLGKQQQLYVVVCRRTLHYSSAGGGVQGALSWNW